MTNSYSGYYPVVLDWDGTNFLMKTPIYVEGDPVLYRYLTNITGGESLPPNMPSTMVSTVVQHQSSDTFIQIQGLYQVGLYQVQAVLGYSESMSIFQILSMVYYDGNLLNSCLFVTDSLKNHLGIVSDLPLFYLADNSVFGYHNVFYPEILVQYDRESFTLSLKDMSSGVVYHDETFYAQDLIGGVTVSFIMENRSFSVYISASECHLESPYPNKVHFDLASFGFGTGTLDLSALSDKIDTVSNVLSIVNGKINVFDSNELNNLHEDILGLNSTLSGLSVDLTPVTTKLDAIEGSLSVVSLQSLNGNGTEFKDGTVVNVLDRTDTFTVLRSYMSLVDSNSYTIAYDLESSTGLKVTCPESLLTLYVAPVVIP